jgi:flagellar capping protein FliD
LQNLIDNQNSALSDLDKKQTTLDASMAAQLTRYQQQFTTLTALLNKAKSTQSQLTDFQTAWSNSLKGN